MFGFNYALCGSNFAFFFGCLQVVLVPTKILLHLCIIFSTVLSFSAFRSLESINSLNWVWTERHRFGLLSDSYTFKKARLEIVVEVKGMIMFRDSHTFEKAHLQSQRGWMKDQIQVIYSEKYEKFIESKGFGSTNSLWLWSCGKKVGIG